jgi:divalent metal cation (Fe/Co/Zn/Cd) transporter
MGVPSVDDVTDIRVRWLGREAEVRLIVQLPASLALTEAHEVAHRVQERVRTEVADVRDVMVEPVPVASEPALGSLIAAEPRRAEKRG